MARIATIIEFAGIPYAGKTSLLLALGIRLENLGRRVCKIQEYRGADEFFERRKLSPDVNLARSLSFLGNLIEDPDTARSDVILCDRGVFDTQCWFNWFGEAQVPASYRALNRAAIDLLLEPRYRYVIVLVERSIEDVVRMHGARAGTIVNGPTLVALQRSYAEEV